MHDDMHDGSVCPGGLPRWLLTPALSSPTFQTGSKDKDRKFTYDNWMKQFKEASGRMKDFAKVVWTYSTKAGKPGGATTDGAPGNLPSARNIRDYFLERWETVETWHACQPLQFKLYVLDRVYKVGGGKAGQWLQLDNLVKTLPGAAWVDEDDVPLALLQRNAKRMREAAPTGLGGALASATDEDEDEEEVSVQSSGGQSYEGGGSRQLGLPFPSP